MRHWTWRLVGVHKNHADAHLAGSEEGVEERAEESNAVVELERLVVLAEVGRELHAQRLQLADVTLQLRQLVAGKLTRRTQRARSVQNARSQHTNCIPEMELGHIL